MPLGVMEKHHLIFVCALTLATWDVAACVAADPVDTARWIYTNQRTFAFQKPGEDLSKRAQFLSPKLYGLLRAEWKCQDVEEGICSLDSDPWLNAQDGDALAPITFELASSTASTATVRMRFSFGWGGNNTPKPVPAEAKLDFVKDAKLSCWLLDDLVGREGRSLTKKIQAYPHAA